ncbi:hypothetical protein [Streptomyces sp. 8N706]|uniref:hypothetical protein n=1 Tax=Streptomyces sp. 8N706 TaxID=3457416 RepID=UPI003FCEF7B5
MTTSSEQVTEVLTTAAQTAEAWAAAGVTVRFVISDPEADVVLDPQGKVTDAPPTHVLRISWSDLQDIAAGRRSFLRSVTGRRLTAHGPVMQTFAFGQALSSFELGA